MRRSDEAPPSQAPFPCFWQSVARRRSCGKRWATSGTTSGPSQGAYRRAPRARPIRALRDDRDFATGWSRTSWRAVKAQPTTDRQACDWPVIEADLHARHLWLIGPAREPDRRLIAELIGATEAAGWCGAGAMRAWIGDGWWLRAASRKLLLGSEGAWDGSHLGDGDGCPRPVVARPSPTRSSPSDRRGSGSALSDRLRAVRVASGDWRRVVASPTTLFPAGRGDAAYRCGVHSTRPTSRASMDYAVGGTE